MNSIVIIPTFHRPELLTLCLERLQRCAEFREVDILFAIDQHKQMPPVNKDVARIVLDFRHTAKQLTAWITPHSFKGNSHCVLSVLATANEKSYDWIYYVEEDVMVAEDFFRWHQAVHAKGNYFASVACANKCNTITPPTGTLEDYYESSIDYSALGVCFPRCSIPAILQHAHAGYFGDMIGYCRKTFPNSRLHPAFTEQDGLIRRVIEANNYKVAWPCVPRAFHAGWYGYNRPGRPLVGSLEHRIDLLRKNLTDAKMLNGWAREAMQDITPCDLSDKQWGELRCVPTA